MATRTPPPADKTTDNQPPPAVYTIAEFCRAHRISLASYYNIKRAGHGPREMVIGARRLISVEAAAEWRAKTTNTPIPSPAPQRAASQE